MVQWIRIHLPMQGIPVRSLVQENPTCYGVTKPQSVLHSKRGQLQREVNSLQLEETQAKQRRPSSAINK